MQMHPTGSRRVGQLHTSLLEVPLLLQHVALIEALSGSASRVVLEDIVLCCCFCSGEWAFRIEGRARDITLIYHQ